MTRSSGMCGTENWVRKRKFLFLVCSFFRSFTELCLLCLPRWAGCQWSKTRGLEVSWQRESTPSHLTMLEGAWCGTEEPCTPLTPLLTLLLCRAESLQNLFQRQISTHGSPCHKQLGHVTSASFSAWRCSSPENCMLTLEMWDKPVKFQEASGRLF